MPFLANGARHMAKKFGEIDPWWIRQNPPTPNLSTESNNQAAMDAEVIEDGPTPGQTMATPTTAPTTPAATPMTIAATTLDPAMATQAFKAALNAIEAHALITQTKATLMDNAIPKSHVFLQNPITSSK
jgi:hypothetical protein